MGLFNALLLKSIMAIFADEIPVAYPFGWLNDLRDVIVVTGGLPDQGQNLILSASGPSIVSPAYGRICLRLVIDGADYFTPWVTINIQPFILPIPRDLRGRYEPVLQERGSQQLALQILENPGLDRIDID